MSEEQFPRMIYHIAEEPKIVYSEDEFKAHLGVGWLPEKHEYAESESLKEKIGYYQEKIVECKKRLFELGKMKDRRVGNYSDDVTEKEEEPEEKPEKKQSKEKSEPLPEDYKYECDFPGCGKKFTKAVALSGHSRSHKKPNEEPK